MLTRKQRFVIEGALLGGTLGLLVLALLSATPSVISRAFVLAVVGAAASRLLLSIGERRDRGYAATAVDQRAIPPLDSKRAVRAHVTLVVVMWFFSAWALMESVPDLAAVLAGLTGGVVAGQFTLIANGTRTSNR